MSCGELRGPVVSQSRERSGSGQNKRRNTADSGDGRRHRRGCLGPVVQLRQEPAALRCLDGVAGAELAIIHLALVRREEVVEPLVVAGSCRKASATAVAARVVPSPRRTSSRTS